MNFSALRSMVGRFLTDSCTITTATTVEFDPDLGYDVDTPGDTVYSGVCWVRPTGGERVVEAGEGPVALRLFDVTLPWSTTGIEVDQLVTVTACVDPHLIGRVLRVVDVQGGSQTPHRRLVCEDTLNRSSVEEEGGS